MKAFILGMALFCFVCSKANSANVYAEIGFYHYLTSSDEKILADDNFGEDTYTPIAIGIQWNCGKWYCLGADEIDTGWHHISHPDRGAPFNEKQESYFDGFGLKARWNFWEF